MAVSQDKNMAGPQGGSLAGLKVLDLTRVLAGPFCTMILADHGADVIKVEAESGDETRGWGPPFDEASGAASYFVGLNRNKRGICLDMKSKAGRDQFLSLLEDADILIENFKPGTMESWDLGYDTLSKRHPALIYCAISGFGNDGPMAGLARYDAILQAMCGLLSTNGTTDTGAMKMGAPIVDFSTGLYSAIAILMAVYERQKSGAGQMIDMTLYDCAMAMLHPHSANYLLGGRIPEPMGNSHPNLAPCEKYQTRTGEIFIAIGNENQFAKLATAINYPEMVSDERFCNNSQRVKNKRVLFEEMQKVLADADGEAICMKLLAQSVPAGPVRTIDNALFAQQTVARNMLIDEPGYRSVASPIKFSRSTSSLRYGPPSHGEHQDLLEDASGYWETTAGSS